MASASAAARLCLSACRRLSRLPALRRTPPRCALPAVVPRSLTTSSARWAGGQKPQRKKREEEEMEEQEKGYVEEDFRDGPALKMINKSFAESLTTEGLQCLDELAKNNGYNTMDEFVDDFLRKNRELNQEERTFLDDIGKVDIGEKPNEESFWHDDEDPDTNTDEDVFDEDDITSMAHGKLDEIREMRHYSRLAVWEMPLLSKLAKPFVPPSDDQVLRWRYTTYMGESHPAEKKVVVQFAPDDLKLTAVQTEKLKKLAGARYNPDKEFVKMSCESFEHQAQNKQYLLKLVDDLIAAAKDPSDTFEDVPLDLRHHKSKQRPKFPKEWRLTDERRRQLDEHRSSIALAEASRQEQGLLVDGQKVVDAYLLEKAVAEQQAPAKQGEKMAVQLKSARRSSGAPSRLR